MEALLDTHIVIWTAYEPSKLSSKAVEILSDPGNRLYFSTATIWEIVIKRSLGRQADYQVDVERLRLMLLRNGYRELKINSLHALAIASLPNIHGDPFDRLLIAQAAVERLVFLTRDEDVLKYPGAILRV